MSLGAYEWPVLVALKVHAIGLSQNWFSNCSFEVQRKPQQANGSQTCELHSRHLVELILAVYREVHAHSFVLKCLLQWHVHVQQISTLEWQA